MAISHSTVPPLPVQDGVQFRYVVSDDRYCVSDDGRIFSCVRRGGSLRNHWVQMNPTINTDGYAQVILGNRTKWRLHRLILSTFTRPPLSHECCCHANGKPSDNRLSNLRWDTHTGNMKDRIAHGTQYRGERCVLSSLTDREAEAIRVLRKRHPERLSGVVAFLARWFAVGHFTISGIASGKIYNPIVEVHKDGAA